MTSLPAHDVRHEDAASWWQHRAAWLYASIQDGALRDHDAGARATPWPVALEGLGSLTLRGGQVVAADPYLMGADPEPFVQRLATQTVDVIAVHAAVGPDHDRVAALVLRAGTQLVRAWAMATVAGQDTSALEPGGCFGYGVDAGTGSFGDPDAMRVAGRVLAADEGRLADPVSRALFADGLGTRSAVIVAPEPGAVPVAACSSGWGDGFYPTWLGLDADGKIVVVVTDFLLAADPYDDPIGGPSEP